MAQRWQVVQLLDLGRHYAEIARETGASTATITRIAQWLHHGTGGYREALAARRGRGRAAPGEAGTHEPGPARARHGCGALDASRDPGRLRLAIPNKGRLLEPTVALLRDAGLAFEDGTRALVARVENFPLDILSVRTEDIAEFVADGVADLGITGTNLLHESEVDLPIVLELGYGRCRLEAAVPNDAAARALEDLAGLRLATSHPNSARRAFAERGHRGRGRAHQRRRRGGAAPRPRGRHRGPRVDRLDAGHERAAIGGRAAAQPGDPGRAATPGGASPAQPRRRAGDDARRGHRRTSRQVPDDERARARRSRPSRASCPASSRPASSRSPTSDMVAVHAVVGADEVHGLLPGACAAPAPRASSSSPSRSCCRERSRP